MQWGEREIFQRGILQEGRMTFTVTYRGADGAQLTETVEAASRAECFAQMKARGITPMGVKDGNFAGKPRKSSIPRNSSTSRSSRKPITALIIAIMAVAIILGGGMWWWMRRDGGIAPRPETPKKPADKVKGVAPAKQDRVNASPAGSVSGSNQVKVAESPAEAVTNKAAIWNGHEIRSVRVVTNGMDIITTRIGVDGKVYKQIEKVNDKPIFSNPVDQALAMMLTTPKGGMIPPMPPLGKDSDEVFIKALKHPIEIAEDDTEEVKKIKRIVQAAREEMLDQIAAGRSVNAVIEEHCTTVNENAQLRAKAAAEYRRIIEEDGDMEMAEQYREKANTLLTNVGAAPIDKRGKSRREPNKEMKGTEL